MTTYEIIKQGVAVEAKRSEKSAIREAESIQADAVVMIVQSGKYKSRTQVWPTHGETWSN
jgi:hypothetical protein